MNIQNFTPFPASATVNVDKDGRKQLVVVCKGTFCFEDGINNKPPSLNIEQLPIFDSISYFGEPGFSAPRHEGDFSSPRPKCDVILNGSAVAPEGVEITENICSLKLSTINKSLRVIGDRYWFKRGIGEVSLSKPLPFTTKAISYDRAYGGGELNPKKSTAEEEVFTYLINNPVGVGYYPHSKTSELDGKPAPNIEKIDESVKNYTSEKYTPVSFGPIGRNWSPRYQLGGTFDSDWAENRRPFLPLDFDNRFYQCVPEDQQTEYLQGGELVEITGMSPLQHISFKIPELYPDIMLSLFNGKTIDLQSNVDTCLIETDKFRFSLVWRASWPVKGKLSDILNIVVGTPTRAYKRAEMLGKEYKPAGIKSLANVRTTKKECCDNCGNGNPCSGC